MTVKPELLELLVCPMGKAPLRLEGEVLVCTRCGPRFSIKDEIPNMLIEEAELPPGCHSLADLDCVRSGEVELERGDRRPSFKPWGAGHDS
jgi:uncharacterized protein YbaR (Trm112 family)